MRNVILLAFFIAQLIIACDTSDGEQPCGPGDSNNYCLCGKYASPPNLDYSCCAGDVVYDCVGNYWSKIHDVHCGMPGYIGLSSCPWNR